MVAAAILGILGCGARAQLQTPGATLRPGDPAPPLVVEKWIKGGPISRFEPGKVYIMEFWATWCGPCIAAMPHVSELQKKYREKGVVVIGMNISEPDRSKVEPMVRKMGQRMDYAVATDMVVGEEPGKMEQTWMTAAGQQGIPCSMIVDRQGKIAWIGTPSTMERPLKAIVDGTFDRVEQAQFEKRVDNMWEEYAEAVKAKEFDKALAMLDRIATTDESYVPNVALQRFRTLVSKGDLGAANKLAQELADGPFKDHGMRMQSLAYSMLASDQAKNLDKHLVLKVATRASELMSEFDPVAPTIVAHAYALRGDFRKAAQVLRGVIENVPEGETRAQLQSLLQEFQQRADKGG